MGGLISLLLGMLGMLIILIITAIGFVAGIVSFGMIVYFPVWLWGEFKSCFVHRPAEEETTLWEFSKAFGVFCVSTFIALCVFNIWIPEVKIPFITPLLYR